MIAGRRVVRMVYRRALQCATFGARHVQVRGSAVYFAPHPDDESLGCGGSIARAVDAGTRVRIVFMTDGAAAGAGGNRAEIAATRMREANAAAAALGVSGQALIFLAFPDGELARYRAEAVLRVRDLLAVEPPDHVFVPYRYDIHEDHVATARIVMQALEEAGLRPATYEYPIWFLHHWPLVGSGITTGSSAAANGDGAQQRRARIVGAVRRSAVRTLRLFTQFRCVCVLDAREIERKRRAIAAHASQTDAAHTFAGTDSLAAMSGGDFLPLFSERIERYHCARRKH